MDENTSNQDIETMDDVVTDITEEEAEGFDEVWGDAPDSDNDEMDLSEGEPDEVSNDEGDKEPEQEAETDAAETDATEEAAEDVKEEDSGEQSEKAEEDKKSDGGETLYTLKSPKGERQCTLEEVMQYANKGLDYDGLKQDRDRLREHDDFLKSLAETSGLTVDELIDNTNARLYKQKMKQDGKEVTDFEALHAVQRERTQRATAAENEAKQSESDKKKNMIETFVKEFPKVEAKSIPQSVWNKAHETGDLASAYREHVYAEKDAQIAKLEAEIKTLKTNKMNKERSTGSQKSFGATGRDSFDDGWNSW